jgi:uncharacterized Zn-finger protein
MSNDAAQNNDHIVVTKTRIACDGGGALGHPKVWMDMGQDTQVKCKYCDRVFVLDAAAKTGGH